MEQNSSYTIRPWLIISLIVVVLAAAGFFGWNYLYNNKPVVAPAVTPTISTKVTKSITPSITPTATSSISTADWKTYTSKDLGLSFKYPTNWFVGEQQASSGKNVIIPDMIQISDSQQQINFLLKENSVGTSPDFRVSGRITRETDLAMFGKTEQDFLRFEAGRSAAPIIEEQFGQQGDVKTYRGIRQSKKGDVANESGDIASYTTTEATYTFLKNNILYAFRVEIRGDDYKDFISILDKVVSTIQFTK